MIWNDLLLDKFIPIFIPIIILIMNTPRSKLRGI